MPLRGTPVCKEAVCWLHRFFNSLHSEVEGLYSGSHLDSNLIEMPAKNAYSESEVTPE